MSRVVVVAELIAVAERWLQQRGVPHFLADTGKFEHRVPHALLGIGFAAACTAVLAAFAGLSYAVTASLFKDQREFFFGELDRKTLQRLGVRALYYRLRAL